MAFLDLDEALEELGYGDVLGTMRTLVEKNLAHDAARQREQYKLNYRDRSARNPERKIGIGRKRFWWFLPVQKERHATGAERLEQRAAMMLARERAEQWA